MAVAGVVAAAVTIIATLASAAATAYAQHQQAQTQGKILKYQSQAAENQATSARQAAAIRAQQEQKRTDAIRARARANAGASGVETGEGSPLLVMLENARQAQYETELIKYGGEIQSAGFETEAKLRTFESRAVRRAGMIGAGTTLLAGVGNAAGTYAKTKSSSSGGDYESTGYYNGQRIG